MEINRPMEDRDKPIDGKKYRRVLPDRFAFSGVEWKPSGTPMTQKEEVLRGYYLKEQREGSKFRARYTKDKIKKVWEQPD